MNVTNTKSLKDLIIDKQKELFINELHVIFENRHVLDEYVGIPKINDEIRLLIHCIRELNKK